MEFYDDFTQIDLDSLEFQFPTGWNSTKPEHQRSRKLCEVSIPNGMEFYAARERLRRDLESFNSQRDGILLKL